MTNTAYPSHPRAPRYALPGLTAILDLGTEFRAGLVVDISATGCLMRTDDALPLLTAVTIIPNHRFDTRLPLELAARVVRVAPVSEGYDMAFELVEMQSAQQERLQSFLAGHGSTRR
jgi:c-di-GMP-binding flagellar brake protein YcgR